MVINQANVGYLLTNFRKNSIRRFLHSVKNDLEENGDKIELLRQAFTLYLLQPENQIYRRAIESSSLYDNGNFTGLITKFIDAI